MQFLSQYSGIHLYLCMGRTVHHCNNFLLGERWEGGENTHWDWGDEWFCKEKKSHWREWKGTLPEKSSFVAGNAIHLCSSWLYNGQEKMDRLGIHPLPGPCCNARSSSAAVFLLRWDPGSTHRWATCVKTCFLQRLLESFDWFSLLNYPNPWEWRVHEWQCIPSNCTYFKGTLFRRWQQCQGTSLRVVSDA